MERKPPEPPCKPRGNATLQARAWELRQAGRRQDAIARELGISQPTVSRWLDGLERRELARLSKRVEQQKVTQTVWCEQIYCEALEAWERSKQPRKRVNSRKNGRPDETTTTTVQQRDGDPRFLQTAIAAIAQIGEIWGLYAPVAKPVVAVESYAEMVKRIKANAAVYTEEGKRPEAG